MTTNMQLYAFNTVGVNAVLSINNSNASRFGENPLLKLFFIDQIFANKEKFYNVWILTLIHYKITKHYGFMSTFPIKQNKIIDLCTHSYRHAYVF